MKLINERAKLGARQRLDLEPIQNKVDLIYIGDSIVQRFDTVGKPIWDHYYGGDRHGLNLGISGERTQNVLWRLDHGNILGLDPKLAVVMIGQNNGGFNSGPQIAEGVIAIIEKLRASLPNTKILLLAIFQRREKPTIEREVLDEANKILEQKYTNDLMVSFQNINNFYVQPDGTIPSNLFPDYEHPSLLGYQKWAEEIEPKVSQLMGDAVKQPYVNTLVDNDARKAQEKVKVKHHWALVSFLIALIVIFYSVATHILYSDKSDRHQKFSSMLSISTQGRLKASIN